MRWIVGIISFFALVFIANGVLLYYALTTKTELYESTPYEKGLHHQEIITRKEQALASGIRSEIQIGQSDSTGVRSIIVMLGSGDGQGIAGERLTLYAKYASDSNFDFTQVLTERGDGKYETSAEMPNPGIWFFDLSSATPEDAPKLWQHRIVVSN